MREEAEPTKQLSCAFSNTLNKYNVDKKLFVPAMYLLTCACYVLVMCTCAANSIDATVRYGAALRTLVERTQHRTLLRAIAFTASQNKQAQGQRHLSCKRGPVSTSQAEEWERGHRN